MTRMLRHAAAGPRLRLLLLYRLFEFEEWWIAAGWRVVNCTAIGRDQWHPGVLRVGFGISEGVCGAVTKVTIEQGVIQQFCCGPLFLQF